MSTLIDHLDTLTTLPAGPLAVLSVAGSFVGGLVLFAAIVGVACLAERAAGTRR